MKRATTRFCWHTIQILLDLKHSTKRDQRNMRLRDFHSTRLKFRAAGNIRQEGSTKSSVRASGIYSKQDLSPRETLLSSLFPMD